MAIHEKQPFKEIQPCPAILISKDFGTEHRCDYPRNHEGPHRCGCGQEWGKQEQEKTS